MLNRRIFALCVAAGTLTSLALASDPHDAAPQHTPAPKASSKAGSTAAKKSPTLTNTKVSSATTANHTTTPSAKAAPKSAAKADPHAKPADDDHGDDKAGKNDDDGDSHGDAPKTTPAAPVSKNKSTSSDSTPDAAEALSLLTEGNARWVSNKPQAPNTDNARREEVAAGQHPMVTILTCADSRIPVERVFDRGVGDVFVIRVAGNVAGGSETGTIEYGVEHLKTPLLVVMGHTKCGAVAAAATNAPVHGFVAKLVSNIQPAVERARRANPDADEKTLSALAVNENVWQSVFDLFKASQPVREMVANGQLKVVGAVYDITTGKVDFLGEHPWQNELLATMTTTPAKPLATHAENKSEPKSEAKAEAKATAAASDHDEDRGSESAKH